MFPATKRNIRVRLKRIEIHKFHSVVIGAIVRVRVRYLHKSVKAFQLFCFLVERDLERSSDKKKIALNFLVARKCCVTRRCLCVRVKERQRKIKIRKIPARRQATKNKKKTKRKKNSESRGKEAGSSNRNENLVLPHILCARNEVVYSTVVANALRTYGTVRVKY